MTWILEQHNLIPCQILETQGHRKSHQRNGRQKENQMKIFTMKTKITTEIYQKKKKNKTSLGKLKTRMETTEEQSSKLELKRNYITRITKKQNIYRNKKILKIVEQYQKRHLCH